MFFNQFLRESRNKIIWKLYEEETIFISVFNAENCTCLDNIHGEHFSAPLAIFFSTQTNIDKLNSEWKFIIKLVPIKINQQQQ